MATAHLISGLPCSGKTTYSKALCSDLNRVHFSLDYWLITAFGTYSIESVGHEEHVRRVLACRELIRRSAAPLLVRGVDVILDDGFFFREHRKQHIKWAVEIGAEAKVHYLRAQSEILKRRVDARNASLPEYNFRIEPGMLDVFWGLFEVPSIDEGAQIVIIDSKSEGALMKNQPVEAVTKVTSLAPQFLVDDLPAAIAYYRDQLGFESDFVYESFYASVSRDGFSIHLKSAPKTLADRAHRKQNEHIDAYVGVRGIEPLFEELKSKGAHIIRSLEDRPWACRDFYVEDPDGYILCFSEESA